MQENTRVSRNTFRILRPDGYVLVMDKEHPRADKTTGYVLEHIKIVEKAIGKPIPTGAVVHHANGNKSDNSNSNLVLCDGDAHHLYIHKRMRAFYVCGDVKKLKCPICGEYDDADNMYVRKEGGGVHRECRNKYLRKWRRNKSD